jgi:hypothetical protein
MEIGLDGVHRVTHASALGEPKTKVGLKGSWSEDNSFLLNMLFLHGGEFDLSFDFKENGIDVVIKEPLSSYQIRGELEN